MAIRKAVIPAAGLGTRFLPATKVQPKEMLPLVDKPIIQYVVEEAVASGITDILIITGRGKRTLEDHFDRSLELEMHLQRGRKDDLLTAVRDISSLATIHFVRQQEPRGLGHAVLQARQHVGDEPFALLLGDELFLGDEPCLHALIGQYEQVGDSVIAVQEVPRTEVGRYGVVRTTFMGDRMHRVVDLVEKPEPQFAPSNLAIVGRYVVRPEIFGILERLPPGRNGEVQLTDGLQILNQQHPVYAFETASERFDVGDKLGYLKATVELALRHPDVSHAFRRYLQARMDCEGSGSTEGDALVHR